MPLIRSSSRGTTFWNRCRKRSSSKRRERCRVNVRTDPVDPAHPHAQDVAAYPPPPSPPSALPIAWNTLTEGDVPDSITGATRRNDASTSRTAAILAL